MICWLDVIGINLLFCQWVLVFCPGYAGLFDMVTLNLVFCFDYAGQFDINKFMPLCESYVRYPVCNYDDYLCWMLACPPPSGFHSTCF
jgi:hypothetical protein